MASNLNSKSKVAVIWDMSGALVRQLAVFIISIILARLLEPEQFGIIAMSMVFIHLSNSLADTGFTVGLVQQKETKDITYSSIFYVNLAISLVLSLVIISSAPMIAEYFEEPIIKTMILFLAVIPPVTAIGKVQEAILIKEINFKSLTIRDITATLIGGVAGVIAAFSQFGVYSLVIQQITISVAATFMLWRATKWFPKLEFSLVEVKKLFSFSSYVFLDNILRQVFSKIDTLFIAKVFSPAILGFYSRAESLKAQVLSYTSTSLNKVLFPVFSQLQDDDEKFISTFFKASRALSGLLALLIGPMYFLSNFIIIFLLTEKWEPSVILFQILILAAFTSPHVNMMARAILSKGYARLKFKVGLAQRVIKLSPLIIGLYYGIQEFAVAMVVAATLVYLLMVVICSFKININFLEQVKNFVVANLIFIIFLIVDLSIQGTINQWLMASLFLVSHITYLFLIKHESYLLVKNITLKMIKRKKNK